MVDRDHQAVKRALAAVPLLAACAAHAQGDGARNYELVPDGTGNFTVFGIYARGNQSPNSSTVVQGARIDIYLSVLQYTHAFALAGNQVQLFGMLPFGRVEGTATVAGRTVSESSSGPGDATIGAMVGLVGAPALSAKEYAEYRPGFTLGALGKVYLPTGEYRSSQVLNLGAGRRALQLGAPMVQYFGKSLLDPSLASLELTPSVSFFGNNDIPPNATTFKQDPLGKLEGHLTRNIGSAFWISVDTLYARGGETITDGVRDGNSQRWLTLGATAGFAIGQTMSGNISYGKVVRHNAGGLEASGWRADAAFAF